MLGVLLAASCTAAMAGGELARGTVLLTLAACAPTVIDSANAKGASLLNKDPRAIAGRTYNPHT
jgi:hypothetical protein